MALLDRCAHRNIPLSKGQVQNEFLECPYHGWQYDSQGLCQKIPGLDKPPDRKDLCVPSFPVCEQQGYVWVFGNSKESPKEDPYSFEFLNKPEYSAVRFHFEVCASMANTLENMLDVLHTSILHKGLFRGIQKNKVTAITRRTPHSVEVEYRGEPRPSGLAGWILSPKGGEVRHYDRFFLPSISQVEYQLGKSHFVTTSALTPITETRTRFYTVLAFRVWLPGSLIRLFLTPVAKKILEQDARILKWQSQNINRFNQEQFHSTKADLMGPHITQLLKSSPLEEQPKQVKEGQIELIV